ncbi:MAG TPA: AraC family transcriptional regulator [Rhodanobacter sp.]|nr:AraC family transcriptional regulator [Rhodanobacter sp.]
MALDLLSDALAMSHLTGASIFRIDVRGPWGMLSQPHANLLVRSLPAVTNHIIVFHVVLDGECWCRLHQREWFRVPAGHAVVLTRGDQHELADRPGRATIPFEQTLGGRSMFELRRERYDTGAGPHASILCGFLGCDRRAFESLFRSLPAQFTVGIEQRSKALLEYAANEALEDRAGADTLRVRMAELLLMEALSMYMQELPSSATGLLAGMRDPLVGRALQSLHEAPGRDWSVEKLAADIDSSRSSLASRFREVTGEPPMHYLARLRMQRAALYLASRACSVDRVAADVGYASSAAFQRAFKRHFGVPPATWRQRSHPAV